MIVFVSTLAVTCYAAIVTGTNLKVEKSITIFLLIFIEELGVRVPLDF